ncbi:hypothetical protein BTN50_0659 [Candidatus Enterovibrio altilux]|uniref:Mobile element protein n=1 Tax=Candidatus Enterovibrio altilux TaxID=1927128 RepID=A0A291B843_9GAMM|nr:hypothetical protein BTN50_0659 [Candidatus Enterovibrio luxaltus]
MDINTHEIIAAALNSLNAIAGEMLPSLLKQTRLRINEILKSSAYGAR